MSHTFKYNPMVRPDGLATNALECSQENYEIVSKQCSRNVSKSCLVLNLWNKTDFFKYPLTNIYIIASGKWADLGCVFRVFFSFFIFFLCLV